MMKRLFILAALALWALSADARQGASHILPWGTVSGLEASEDNGVVTVSFRAHIDSRAAGRNERVAFVPVLTGSGYGVSLQAVVIERQGHRRRIYAPLDALSTTNGQTIEYTASVEAQQWMHGGSLHIESARSGCGTACSFGRVVLADDLRLYDQPQDEEVVTLQVKFVPMTLADSLRETFRFVLPDVEFDPENPFAGHADEQGDSSPMVVYFRQSSRDIDKTYKDNDRALTNLATAVEMILASPASRVERVVIAGFSSPEGSFEFNDRLAFDRAVAVKHHILTNTGLRDEQILVYNGSVDWKGLRLLVERSDMPDKQAVLDIIDHTPVWDARRQTGRLGALMRLGDGEAYRYMLQELFPQLRSGAFIRVYYSNE